VEYLRNSFQFRDEQTSFSSVPAGEEDTRLLQKSPFFGCENSTLRFDFQNEESKVCLNPTSKKPSQFSLTETQQSSATAISSLTNKLTIGAFMRRTHLSEEDSSTTFESSPW
jgi:hypothetical protein